MRKSSLVVLVLVFSLLWGVLSTQAANIHLHFFESIDTVLEDQRFQTFSFFGDSGEPITIVSYGLQDGTAPSLVLLDTMGATLTEDLNANGLPVATIEATLPQAGIYTFVVSRISEQGGVFRVMVFSGDPLKAGETYMDTIDPLLPARAYLLAGIGDINTEIQLEVVPDASGNPIPNEIFVSRGTDQDPPPLAERLNPGSVFSWVNEAGVTFYTITARATPELVPTSGKPRGLLSLMAQTLDLGFVKIQVTPENTAEEETPDGEIVFIRRNQLIGQITYPTAKLAGPGGNYRQQDVTESGIQFEIVAQSGNYFLVVDPNSPTGGSWIRKDRFELVPDPLIQALRESHLASNPDYAELIENIVQELEAANTFESLEALAPIIEAPPLTDENRSFSDDADDDEELDDDVDDDESDDDDDSVDDDGLDDDSDNDGDDD